MSATFVKYAPTSMTRSGRPCLIDAARLLACTAALTWAATTTCAQELPVGTRLDLTPLLGLDSENPDQRAQLFIPLYVAQIPGDSAPLIVHLHGPSRVVERALTVSGAQAVLVTLHLGPLSSAYRAYFSDTTAFERMLSIVDSVLAELGREREGRLVVTSFSAGYAGVREILKRETCYRRINAILLADGLHADDDESIMQCQMADFCRFAEDASKGKKVLIVTHSSVPTQGYRSTTQTADYLLGCLRAERIPQTTQDEIGTMTYVCSIGCVRITGYEGESAPDHMRHLHGMHLGLHAVMSLRGAGCLKGD